MPQTKVKPRINPRFPAGNGEGAVPMVPRYLNRREAAAYLGFSVEKLIDLIRAKSIAEYDFGHSCKRYRAEDLDAYAATCKIPARRAA
jgi:excisionase family DNA binding protein